jgi:hypothetical protein
VADGDGVVEAGENDDGSNAAVRVSGASRLAGRLVEPPRPAPASSCASAMLASSSSCTSAAVRRPHEGSTPSMDQTIDGDKIMYLKFDFKPKFKTIRMY